MEYFRNNVPQHQTAKALQILSSTVHNIIKRFREPGEISVHKGQGRRPLLDAHGLRALRQDCITHRHDSFIDIAKWAQEYFQKTTVGKHNSLSHLQMPTKALSCKKEAICEHSPEEPLSPVGQGSFKIDCFKVESVLWSDESKCDILVGNQGRRVLQAKEEGDLPAFYQRSVQKPASLMVWGCTSAYVMGSLHVLEGTMNAERYIKVIEQHMLPSRWRLFHGRPCVFQQDNAKPHTAATTAWLRSRRVRVLNWPAWSPDISPIENIWRHH